MCGENAGALHATGAVTGLHGWMLLCSCMACTAALRMAYQSSMQGQSVPPGPVRAPTCIDRDCDDAGLPESSSLAITLGAQSAQLNVKLQSCNWGADSNPQAPSHRLGGQAGWMRAANHSKPPLIPCPPPCSPCGHCPCSPSLRETSRGQVHNRASTHHQHREKRSRSKGQQTAASGG